MTVEAFQDGLHTILVDMTPVLPGGENGGAKVFVIELLRRLAELAPNTKFILLTRESSHEELAALDRPNVSRLLVLGENRASPARSLLERLTSRAATYVPGRAAMYLRRISFRVKRLLKGVESSNMMRKLSADLLFCPFTAPTYAESVTPTVSVIYDLQYKAYPQFFTPEDVIQRQHNFASACEHATMLTAISEYSRREAIAEGRLDPDKIRTIHLQISDNRRRDAAPATEVLPRLGLQAKQYLMYPANFWKHKNHEMLLTAFAMARRNGLGDDIKLVCTGAPNARHGELKRAAIDFGLGSHVIFPGYLPSAELLTLLMNSAGMVFPSLYEGFGLPVIEAMAIGVPVACSNVTSLPEVAHDAAILFDPRKPQEIAAAIISLVNNRELVARLVDAGRLRAAQFSDSMIMAEQYWAVFRQAAAATTERVAGVYADGWAGPALKLRFARAAEARTLELELTLPGWAPSQVALRSSTLVASGASKILRRASQSTFSFRIPPDGGYHEVNLSPTFIPAKLGLGEDQRELSAMLLKCSVVSANGNDRSLFPESRRDES